MSLSKLFKIIAVILVILIVGVAIYIFMIIPKVKKSAEVNVTPVVTPILPTTPASTDTTTDTLCGESCTNSPCIEGTVCTVVKGFRRCVSKSCVDSDNKPVQNDGCNSDFCLEKEKEPTPSQTPETVPTISEAPDKTITPTPTKEIKATVTSTITPTPITTIAIPNKPFFVDKIASGTKCVTGSAAKTSTITIAIENLGEVERTVSIKDILQNVYPVTAVTSINLGGIIKDNYVVWENTKLPPKQTVTLQYTINTDIKQKTTYTNTIEIMEGEFVVQTEEKMITIDVLPCTDLSSDQVKLLLLGIAVLFLGFVSFKFNTHKFLGTVFLNKVVGKTSSRDFEDKFRD